MALISINITIINWRFTNQNSHQPRAYIKNQMQLIFQNTKQLKETRQFIKGLCYVYDSIDNKQKQIYLYISGSYIAITNNFFNTNVPNYRVCFCKLKKNMYKIKNFFNVNNQSSLQNQGVMFYLEADLLLKLLNTQIQPDITQMILYFPELGLSQNQQHQMRMSYETVDGVRGMFKLYTKLQNTSWPFKSSVISSECLPASHTTPFLTFPSKFVKQIEYYKKFVQFWIVLNVNGIYFKRLEGENVVSQQLVKSEVFGMYDYNALNKQLKSNINLRINSQSLFHHLEFSNKQGRRTEAKILIEQYYSQEQQNIKRCFLCLSTQTQKKQIHELFQISARETMDYTGQVREIQRLKLRIRDTKKQQQDDDERIILNKFYGPEYEDSVHRNMLMRENLLRNVDAKGEVPVQSDNPRKFKVEY